MTEYVKLALPEDTITTTATNARIALTPVGDGQHVIAQLIIDTQDIGTFQILLPRSVMSDLASAVDHYRTLTPEDMRTIVTALHQTDEDNP